MRKGTLGCVGGALPTARRRHRRAVGVFCMRCSALEDRTRKGSTQAGKSALRVGVPLAEHLRHFCWPLGGLTSNVQQTFAKWWPPGVLFWGSIEGPHVAGSEVRTGGCSGSRPAIGARGSGFERERRHIWSLPRVCLIRGGITWAVSGPSLLTHPLAGGPAGGQARAHAGLAHPCAGRRASAHAAGVAYARAAREWQLLDNIGACRDQRVQLFGSQLKFAPISVERSLPWVEPRQSLVKPRSALPPICSPKSA